MALLATRLPAAWQRRVCALGGGPFEAHLRAEGIPWKCTGDGPALDPLPVAALWRSIIDSRPDVVHSWGWISTLVAGPLCRLLKVPLIDGTIRTGALRPEHVLAQANRHGLRDHRRRQHHAGMQAWGISPAKARVVHNGFDWSRVQACLAGRWP